MSFGQAVKHVFSNYANFQGRAGRSEFWWFYLFMVIVNFVLYVIYMIGMAGSSEGSLSPLAIVGGILLGAWFLATIIPVIAVWVRRLHDTDKSGWWYLLVFACGVGGIVLLVFALLPSSIGPNRYGEGPATA